MAREGLYISRFGWDESLIFPQYTAADESFLRKKSGGDTFKLLFQRCGHALYRAKQTVEDRFALYDGQSAEQVFGPGGPGKPPCFQFNIEGDRYT